MLRDRLIGAFSLLIPLLALFYLDVEWNLGFPGLWLMPLTLVVGLMLVSELIGLLRQGTPGVSAAVVYFGTVATIGSVAAPELWALTQGTGIPVAAADRWTYSSMALFITFAAVFAAEFRSFEQGRVAVSVRVALAMFMVLYAGWLPGFLLAMRLSQENLTGALAVFSFLLIIKLSDVGAYVAGKNFGRTKLAPKLSPKKTVEGLVGGVLAGLLASLLFFEVVGPSLVPEFRRIHLWAQLGYALSITLMGVFGDLCESLIKRDMQRKDSSRWLPGLGGMLDAADSVLISAPVGYWWWSSGWLGE